MKKQTVVQGDLFQDAKKKDILMIDYRNIVLGWNARDENNYGDIEELADSLHYNGQETPLQGKGLGDGKYLLIAGFRRHKATQLNIDKGRFDVTKDRMLLLPVAKTYSEEDILVNMFTSNNSKPLEILEQAEVVRRLLSKGWKQNSIAQRIGKPAQYITNLNNLLAAPTALKNKIKDNVLSSTLVAQILKEEKNPDEIVTLIESISSEKSATSNKKVTKKDIDKAMGKYNSLTLNLHKESPSALALG